MQSVQRSFNLLFQNILFLTFNQDQFLSPLFLVKNKDGGNRPVVSLKDLNSNVPYLHFKMDKLFLLRKMLLPGDKMCKIDLKDAYFAILLSVKSKKYVQFQ